MHRFALPLLFLLVVACHRSGTWVDDPKNVERAWGVSLPAEVTVVHSWYWRSAHFTLEEAYYFQITWNEELYDGFIRENLMKQLPSQEASKIADYICFDRPSWFAPGNPDDYEIWLGPSPTNGVMLRSNDTNDLFVGACQL